MVQAIRQKVVVQPGGRIEIHVPEFSPGTRAEVIILEDGPPARTQKLRSVIGSGKGSFSTPEEADTFLRQERDSWE